MAAKTMLEVPALELTQNGRTVYQFAVAGPLLARFAAVSRIHRDDFGKVLGYQRPLAMAHIHEIRGYLETAHAILPNAPVLAMSGAAGFRASGPASAGVRCGWLALPLDRPEALCLIVDGQQRSAAIQEAGATLDAFPVPLVAFVTDDESEQTEQFVRLNNVKPLPKALILELLPSTEALPTKFEKRRLPVEILERLNRDADSPFCGLIKTQTNPQGFVADNTVLRMLEQSLSDGYLWRLRESGDRPADFEGMVTVIKRFWQAVAETFPAAWGLPPRQSRLLHAAGVQALGFIMNAIADDDPVAALTVARFRTELARLADQCRWTEGAWDFGRDGSRPWNRLQNTSTDIKLLCNHLVRLYHEIRKRGQARASA